MKNLTKLLSNYLGHTIFLFGLFSFQTAFGHSTEEQVKQTTLVNFSSNGQQVTRFDLLGAALDAHDGEIVLFDGTYYLYGTSYDCGYEWHNPDAPFCGFKVYSSPDLVHWTDNGFLFDAQTEIWQIRCNGKTYGCYRPHVVYNKKNNQYVLWINTYDNRVGFRVFTSPTPIGPFTEVKEPTLAVNSDAPIGGLNNGDHDVFVDEDGTAYLSYTDWRTGGTLVIDKLNEDYTSGTGEHVKNVTSGNTEAPALMRRNDTYYILYSDPNCGYCTTGTSYKTAPSPLGPWSDGIKISINSCGGQPAFVSTIKLENETIFLYGSDLWNNGAANEALANYFWAPLEFAPNGMIYPIECKGEITLPIKEEVIIVEKDKDLDCTSGTAGFNTYSDIDNHIYRGQSFVATRTGNLTGISFNTSKTGYPDEGLIIEIYKSNEDFLPIGEALSSNVVPVEAIGWSPKFITVCPNVMVDAGTRYTMIIKTNATTGRYGFQYSDDAPYPGGGAIYSQGGEIFHPEKNRTLMFKTFVSSNDTNISDSMTETHLNTYPNPVKQYLNISLNEVNQPSDIKIFDNMGKEVISKHISDNNNKEIAIDVSSLNSGIYVVKLEDGSILKKVKIIKQ